MGKLRLELQKPSTLYTRRKWQRGNWFSESQTFFFLRYVFIHFRETKCARVEGGGGGERSKWGERGRERKEERRSS